MLMFTFDFTNMYREEYQWGWIDKYKLQNYVQLGTLKPENYKKIVGEDYVAPQAQPAQPNAQD